MKFLSTYLPMMRKTFFSLLGAVFFTLAPTQHATAAQGFIFGMTYDPSIKKNILWKIDPANGKQTQLSDPFAFPSGMWSGSQTVDHVNHIYYVPDGTKTSLIGIDLQSGKVSITPVVNPPNQQLQGAFEFDVITTTTKLCGNGVVDPGEQCDDGNNLNGDGCEGNCTTTPVIPVCGNSTIETGEECDDGNSVKGDGCSEVCKNEAGGTPQKPSIYEEEEETPSFDKEEEQKPSFYEEEQHRFIHPSLPPQKEPAPDLVAPRTETIRPDIAPDSRRDRDEDDSRRQEDSPQERTWLQDIFRRRR